MVINKLLTTINKTAGSSRPIQYIVIHYVGATGDAKANCEYYASEYVGASAHYFVGHKGDVWQSVEDKDTAWHCGTKNGYKHAYCRNSNSIGIEMCCHKSKEGVWYFEDATVNSTLELVRELMKKYNIPLENVIRHYDVTGKNCPAPYVLNNTKHKWDDFVKRLKLDNVPDEYAETAIKWALDNGVLKGTGEGDLKLHSSVTRQDMLVFLHRALIK
jgi:N-acetyl-anhydromuramyl-L-alanine amidase AmpD